MQLTEKQKVKFVYGIMEKQFHMYYEKANRMQGKTGEESADSHRAPPGTMWCTAWASPRPVVRPASWTTHGHFTVNGQRGGHPLLPGEGGDVIEVREKSRASVKFKGLVGEDAPMVTTPKWLGARQEYPPGQGRCPPRPGRHRLPRGRAPHRRAVL